MTFDKSEVYKIVHKVAQQILSETSSISGKRALAIISGYVFNEDRIFMNLRERQADIALLSGTLPECEGLDVTNIKTEEDKARLVRTLGDYEEVVLVTPPLSLLRAISQADDSVFEAMLVLRPLLWGRKVTLLLDFDSPAFRRNTMLEGLSEALGILEKAGVGIVSLVYKSVGTRESLDLVTEQEIKDAYRNEIFRIKVKEGAIVTHLAIDTAKELGIIIDY